MDLKGSEEMRRNSIVLVLYLVIISVIIIPKNLLATISSQIDGLVVDKRTGKPIEGVKVKVFYFKRKIKKEGFYYDKTVTDKDGKFEVFLEREGYYLLMYYPPSPYAMCNSDEEFKKNLIKVERGKRIKIIRKFERGGKLILEVRDKGTGERVDDIEVDFARFGYEYVHYHFKVRKKGKGIFMNDQLYKGRYKIAVLRESYWMKAKEFEIDYGEEKRIRVYFNSKSKTGIEGRIICKESGEGLKFSGVGIARLNSDETMGVLTDDKGNFIIKDIPFGEYKVYTSIEDKEGNKEYDEEKYKLYEKKVVLNVNKFIKVLLRVDCGRIKAKKKGGKK